MASAYVKPGPEPAAATMAAAPGTAARPPPDFTARQGYLDAAPGGHRRRFAWTQAGGSGHRRADHRHRGRLALHPRGPAPEPGRASSAARRPTDLGWRNHGTAVVGEFGGDRNGLGVIGIAPRRRRRHLDLRRAGIRRRHPRRRPTGSDAGDIILIELHRPGPRHDFADRADQGGYIAIEWWPDDFAAIRYAVEPRRHRGRGGRQRRREPRRRRSTTRRPPGFPATWRNPFNRANRDSGAIVVGAGAPPPGTHGRDHGPDRSRLDFSNYGAARRRPGLGPRGDDRPATATSRAAPTRTCGTRTTFSGTSSASPIVVGALGCLQGIARGARAALLTPAQAPAVLRATGSPQQDAPGPPGHPADRQPAGPPRGASRNSRRSW